MLLLSIYENLDISNPPNRLPKIDQECHTYIINNKRKNNYRNTESTKNQFTNQKVSNKFKNVVNQNPVNIPVQVPVPVQMQVPLNNTSYPVPIAPPQCQYNNYCNCTQVNHIENVNNINVNLFLPAPNPMFPQIPQIPQGNLLNSSFTQQVQSFNNSRTLEGFNNNLFVPPNPMELGIMWNPGMIPLSNNNMMSNYTYNPYFSGFQQQNNPYLNQTNMQHYNQDPPVYNQPKPNKAYDQYPTLEKPTFSMQDLCRMENQQLLLKRRISNDIDEFEPVDFKKRHYIDLVQLNN